MTSTISFTAADDFAARLTAACTSSASRDLPALTAFAALDPGRAAEWLLTDPGRADAIAKPRLARLLATLAEAIIDAPGSVAASHVLGLMHRHGHLLTAEQASELAAIAVEHGRIPDLDAALRASLDRAPSHNGLLRSAAELALASGDHARAHELLTRLGTADTRLATVQFAHAARARLPRTGEQAIRVALLSSFTIDPLVPYLDLGCRTLRLEPSIYVAPYNTWEREAAGMDSGLQRFGPQVAFLATAADDLIPSLSTCSARELEAAGAEAVDRLLGAAERFTAWSQALFVVYGLYTAFRDPLGHAANRQERGRNEVLAELNARLAEGLRELPRSYLLDVGDVLTRRRGGAIDNPKLRHLASMRLSEPALADVARAHLEYIAPVAGRTRKCIVVDLDNTLWGGIVGEDGPHGIRLGTTSPGSEYREFQDYLRALSQRGMLLAVNSKNNAADALEVLRSHEYMVLREDAFSAMRINWEPKPQNMIALAEQLGLGLDSFVFVDDSDKERALMRHSLPQVLTPEMPRDPARYRETLEALPELQVLGVTDEDRTRTRQYAERRERERLRVTATSPAEYLASLDIVAEIGDVTEATLPRTHQLFQRTNQFNLTTRRYALGTIAAWAADSSRRVLTAKVRDRFGDHGLVAAAVVHREGDEWMIDNLVMSCRVIGYGVEDALLAWIGDAAARGGATRVSGEFLPCAKNVPAADFYERNGFTREQRDGGGARWRRELQGDPLHQPAWIDVRGTHGA